MNLVRSAYSVPTEFALFQNYPNPFNPATAVNYQIPMTKSQVQTTLKVYNILGQEVMTLVDELQGPGYYKATWDGRDGLGNGMPSGVYFCRLKSGNFTDTKRMLLVK